jgi:hypothetical protein
MTPAEKPIYSLAGAGRNEKLPLGIDKDALIAIVILLVLAALAMVAAHFIGGR